MADTTPAKAFSVSTAVVPPQNRIGQPTDYEHSVYLSYPDAADAGTDSGTMNWTIFRKLQITGIIYCNGDLLNDTATNTTALDIDIEDNAGAKTHDVAALAAATSTAADIAVALTLSTTTADLVVENTEIVKVGITVAGAQSSFGVVIKYVLLDTIDHATVWPIVPKG